MDAIEGKHFSIADPKGIKTVIYQINKTKKEFLKQYPKDYNRKTFYVENIGKNGNQLAIFSFGKDRVIINTGILLGNEVKITKKPTSFKFNTIYSETETEYKEFNYTPNLKRPITIIDPETTEEIKPTLYYDEKTDTVKGKCKIKPYKSYFAFEVREDD